MEHEVYMAQALALAQEAAAHGEVPVGCVIVKDRQLLVTGYVGSPAGLPHCDEVGHLFRKTIEEDGRITNHCVRTVHAEQNAIIQAAKLGVSIDGATLYCTHQPCSLCAKMIINAGIKRVVFQEGYPDQFTLEIFAEAGVSLEQYGREEK